MSIWCHSTECGIGERVKQKLDRNPEHLIGLLNHTGSVRFVLTVNAVSRTYCINVVKPDTFVMHFTRKCKVSMNFDMYDSMDDLQQGIDDLAEGFKEARTDHIHCWKGGKEHTHKVDAFGLKVPRECPTKKHRPK